MEPYHTQPPAQKKCKIKLKKDEEKQTTPPHYFNRTVPTSTEPKKKNPVQPRHLLQANTPINCTGPTRHIAEPHTDRKYTTQPARKVPTNPAPKVNRTRDENNKWTNTHETPPKYNKNKEKSHEKNIKRKPP